MMDVLRFIMTETAKGGAAGRKKALKEMPVIEKNDVPLEEIDQVIKSTENGAPVLYLFFKKGSFDIAEVATDNCTIHLNAATVVKALIGFMSVYYSFHVGYAPEHESFLYFMQSAFIGDTKLPQRVSVGVTKLLYSFNLQLKAVKESRGYKRLCVI